MKFHALAGLSGLALVLGACAGSTPSDRPDDFGYDGKTGIQFNISPLTLNGTTDGCYSFAVVNGLSQYVVGRGPSAIADNLPGAAGVPATNTPADGICGSRFGQGAEVSYVAPCDASEAARDHTVHLWVEDLCTSGTVAGGDCVSNTTFQNPCPTQNGCFLEVQCTENADTPVTFNFTIMDSARQGFFDIAVNFENIFCSAKLDTCYDVGTDNQTPINLLFNATGTRIPTSVLALACTTGEGAVNNTFLHLGNVTVTCGTETTTLDLSTVTQEGNQTSVGGLSWAVYYGSEQLETSLGVPWNKEYFNVAVAGYGPGCSVSWNATATDGTALSGDGAGVYNSYPVINYGPTQVTEANGDWICSENPVNGDDSDVGTTYEPCTTPGDCLGGPCVTEQAGVFYDCEAGEPPVQLGCPDGQGITVVTDLMFSGEPQQPAVYTIYVPPSGATAGGQPVYSATLQDPNGPAVVSLTYSDANGWTLTSDPAGPAILEVTHPTLVGTWSDFSIVTPIPIVEVVGVTVSCGQATEYICVSWSGQDGKTLFSGEATLFESEFDAPASVSGWGQNQSGAVNVFTDGTDPWDIQLSSTLQVATGVGASGNPVPGTYNHTDDDTSVSVILTQGPCAEPEQVVVDDPLFVTRKGWDVAHVSPSTVPPTATFTTMTDGTPASLPSTPGLVDAMVLDLGSDALVIAHNADQLVFASQKLAVTMFNQARTNPENGSYNIVETEYAWATEVGIDGAGPLYIASGVFSNVSGYQLVAFQFGRTSGGQMGLHVFRLALQPGAGVVAATRIGYFAISTDLQPGAETTWSSAQPAVARRFLLHQVNDSTAQIVVVGPYLMDGQDNTTSLYRNTFSLDMTATDTNGTTHAGGLAVTESRLSLYGFLDTNHVVYHRPKNVDPPTDIVGVLRLDDSTIIGEIDMGTPYNPAEPIGAFGSYSPVTGKVYGWWVSSIDLGFHQLGTDPSSLNFGGFSASNRFYSDVFKYFTVGTNQL